MTESVNDDLADELEKIGTIYQMDGDTYREKTYFTAAERIRNYPDRITSGREARKNIKGIGESVSRDIDEFLATGHTTRLQQLEASHAERSRVIELFESIFGIGPVLANRFYNQGYRTLEDLWFKANLTPAMRLAIQYKEHLKLRIPRYEMDIINQVLKDIFSRYDPHLQWLIVGSYRRGEESSGDVDVLIREEPGMVLSDIVQQLKNAGIIPGDLALGHRKYLGLIQIPGFNAHRLDLLLIPPQNWATSLMYFTGSQRFNILMRSRAQELDLRLNEYSLSKSDGTPLPTNTEEDIFRYLGVQYIPPEGRLRNLQSLPLI